ncbi:hypothetical protein GY45DRAFT_1326831 [Cubamyces sp. BRFM 1775]|nr:hypothetical protein GY45DRAFT_1326831 [Cubamyces sp. BRFM 1775]
MSDERPCKRLRTGSSSEEHIALTAAPSSTTPVSGELKRDGEVWFPAGNIILVASGQVAFRVYQGILSRRSEVFRGLFELPPPPDSEKMDDCPIVHLPDDPLDLKQLLLVICCRKNYFYRQDVVIPTAFPVLSALIRMSHKYGVQDLYDTALSRLKRFYTSDFETWRDVEGRKHYVQTSPADALAVIEIAHITDNPSLIPTAYLMCCSLDTLVRKKRTHDQILDVPMLSELTPWDLQRVFTGKARLAQRRAAGVLAIMQAAPCKDCDKADRCSMATLRTLQRIDVAEIESSMHDKHVFDPLASWLWKRGQFVRLCGPCTRAVDTTEKRMKLETWCKLPEIFDLRVPAACWPTLSDVLVEEEYDDADEDEDY